MARMRATREENEALACYVEGCGLKRYGWNLDCLHHVNERAERKREIYRRVVETRRLRHPHRFQPTTGNPEHWKTAANAAVAKAKKLGILPDLVTGLYACVDCGGVASQYDHRNYARPLDVEPVCASCNCKRGSAKYPDASDYNFKLLPVGEHS